MSRCRVMVVDREESIREFLGLALSDDGYTVEPCERVESALCCAQTFQPQIILLDILSPNGNESIFLREYHRLPGPHAPIIGMTTAFPVDSLPRIAGIAHVVQKPFDLEHLLSVVQTFTPAQ